MPPVDLPETRFQRILFCTDFSESAHAAFEFALDAAMRRPGSTLCILHVIPEADAQFWRSYLREVDNLDEQARWAIDDKIAQSYLARVPAGLSVTVELRIGPEAPTILEFAERQNIDLMVIGRHGRSGISTALFGRVAEKIVRRAGCAVLVVPLSYARPKSD